MQALWAPWRMAYIDGLKVGGCIFCQKAGEEDDARNLIIFRGNLAFVLLNVYPYNNGHLMIAPYRHLDGLDRLSPEELLEIMMLAQRSVIVLTEVLKADGFNIGINQGKIAGAGIEEHLHLHIVPRWGGDTNFMPVLGNTKVMPESLESTYTRLFPFFREALQ